MANWIQQLKSGPVMKNVGWLEILVRRCHIRINLTNPVFLLQQRLLGSDDWICDGVHTGLEHELH